jgi:cytidine deaminase
MKMEYIMKYNIGFNNKKKHAEVSSLTNMNMLNLENKSLTMIVLRINKSGKLCSSKPCDNCINFMNKMTKKFNFILNTIYYSTESGTLERSSLYELINDKNKYVSTRFKK